MFTLVLTDVKSIRNGEVELKFFADFCAASSRTSVFTKLTKFNEARDLNQQTSVQNSEKFPFVTKKSDKHSKAETITNAIRKNTCHKWQRESDMNASVGAHTFHKVFIIVLTAPCLLKASTENAWKSIMLPFGEKNEQQQGLKK